LLQERKYVRTMAPLKPHWTQPSHPHFLQLIVSEAEFTSKSVSTASAAPFAVVAKLSFPPCALADEPTYATVQIGRNRHLNLNSDLLYLNHSCEPSLVSLLFESNPEERNSSARSEGTCWRGRESDHT
jgi:hypothetical protein